MSDNSSGVYLSEIDLSQVIANAINSTGALVFASSQGVLGPFLTTNTTQFVNTYGAPNPQVSFAHYAALAFLQQANQLYCNRVAGTGYQYAGAVVQQLTTTATSLFLDAQTNPTAIDLSVAINGSTLDQNLSYVYAAGPGSYAANVAIQLVSQNMLSPTGLSAAFNVVGSYAASATLTYEVTAVNGTGETLPTSLTTTTTASGQGVTLTWNTVLNATSYKVYLGGNLLAITTTPTFLDTGAIVPVTTGVTPPATYAGTPYFNLYVFDLTKNATVPTESFQCTLQNNVNGLGQQTEFATVVNNVTNGSNYVQVVNAASAYPSVGLVYTTAQVALTGGASGAAITDSGIVNGWNQFTSKANYSINMLINGGYSTPAVQLAMDSLAATRGDCTAILDVPSTEQSSSAAVSYRINTLNLDSNHSALYTPDVLILDTYNGQEIYVPPSGYVAAQYAYNDSVASPALAPAGLNRGVLNILGVRVVYDQGDRDLLSANQVNYIRKFQGQGYAIMEAWTLQSKTSGLSFVSVRRILNVIEQATQNALLYSLWDPLDPATQIRIVGMLNDYLQALKLSGQIQDYNVVSNTSDNPVNDTNQGILTVDVYILPTLPIQRIRERMILTKQGLSFSQAALLVGA